MRGCQKVVVLYIDLNDENVLEDLKTGELKLIHFESLKQTHHLHRFCTRVCNSPMRLPSPLACWRTYETTSLVESAWCRPAFWKAKLLLR